MYESPVFPFDSLTNTVKSLGLSEATAVTGKTLLERNGISSTFSDDFIQAGTRMNYAQNLQQLHGLETLVSVAAEGAISVKGGNYLLFKK